MANPWFRLWTDMVNDPKWRTIARVSDQKIGDVLATFLHMMTMASNARERGRTQGWKDEDIATALDIGEHQVAAIREAMQGRVLDGDYLIAWEQRQPLREDGASERGKAFREAKKVEKEREQTDANASERKRTLDKIRREEIRTTGSTAMSSSSTDGDPIDLLGDIIDADTPPERDGIVPPVKASPASMVFEHWKQSTGHAKAKLDSKRLRAITARLKDGYSVEDLCKAVDGCMVSPHHQGQNESNTVYDDIELICRDGPRVDKFIALVDRAPAAQSRLSKAGKATAANAQAWLDEQEQGGVEHA